MSNLEKIDALENKEMLNDMLLDFAIFKLNRVWNSSNYIWNRWIRSNKNNDTL